MNHVRPDALETTRAAAGRHAGTTMNKVARFKELGLRNTANMVLLYCLKKHELFQRFVRIRPVMASIKVTEACNSRCITCTLGQKHRHPDELSQAEIMDLMEQLVRAGCRYVRFTGGEPLLRKDLPHLISQARKLGFQRVYVATNGLLLKKRALDLEGTTDVCVSLDGLEEVNDTIRGVKGDFRLSTQGIQRIREHFPGVRVEIATTLLAMNLKDVQGLIQLCVAMGARWFVNLFDTNPYFFQGIESAGFKPDRPGEVREAVAVIRGHSEKHPESFAFGQKEIDAVEAFLLHGTFPRHCILGYTNIDIDSTGEVYSGCWAMKPMGNIRRQPLEAILTDQAYTRRAMRMLTRQCPQCTCGWMVNTLYDNL